MKARTNKVKERKFNKLLQELLMKKTKGKQNITRHEYSVMVKKVTAAKEKTARWRTEDELKCLRKYDVVKVGRTKKLIAPLRIKGDKPRYFVHDREIFNILHRLHYHMKHGSTNRMHNELKSKYKNISREIVKIYMKLCPPCAKKMRDRKPKLSEEEIERRKNLTRGQVECLRMYPRGRGPTYNHLLMYHDHVNHYDVARPIGSERIDQIARVLSDIFALFGTPDILQSMREGDFVERIVNKLCRDRPELKIEPEEIKFEETWKKVGPGVMISRDPKHLNVGDIFSTWMFEIADRLRGRLSDVMEGGHGRSPQDRPSPYDAMFVRNLKTSPSWSHLSGYTLNKIRAENLVQNRKPIVRLYNKSY